MRTSILTLLVVIEFLATNLVQAQTPSAAATAKIETTIDMRENASKELKIADAQLNRVYNELLSRIDDSNQKINLKAAQKAWLKYRDANALFEAAFYEGGTIQPQIHTLCLVTMTQKRTQELQFVLKNDFDR